MLCSCSVTCVHLQLNLRRFDRSCSDSSSFVLLLGAAAGPALSPEAWLTLGDFGFVRLLGCSCTRTRTVRHNATSALFF